MTLTPEALYHVSIADRGSGTVKVIRTVSDNLVDSLIVHGKFKNRVPHSQVRIDGDYLCFYQNGEGVKIKPLEKKEHGK